MNDPNDYPPGWDAERVRKVVEYHDGMDEDDWAAEDEAALWDSTVTWMAIPKELVPAVRALLAEHPEDKVDEAVGE